MEQDAPDAVEETTRRKARKLRRTRVGGLVAAEPWRTGGARSTMRIMSDDVVVKDELQSAIQARRELGEEMEPAVIDAFVERIERRLADRGTENERALQRKLNHQKEMVLGSMGISVPLFAFAAIFTGLPGVIVVCVALVAIAVVTTRS
jgi:Flp pilus assembly protein TadB